MTETVAVGPCGHEGADLKVRANGVRDCLACRRERRRRARTGHPRRPLVSATRAAVEQAQRLGIEGVLENRITVAIGAGRLRFDRKRDEGVVFLEGFVAVVERSRSPLTGRKAWRVVAVREGAV